MRDRSSVVVWGVFATLVTAYALVAAAVPQFRFTSAALDAVYLSVVAIALLATARATRAATGIERRAWALLAATVALLAVGDLLWIVREALAGTAAAYGPSVAYVFYAAGYIPLILYAVVVLASGLSGAPVLTKVRYLLDLMIAILLASSAVVVFLLLPSYHAVVPGDFPAWSMHAMLLIASTSVFVALLAAILESSQRLWARWESKVVIAMGLAATAEAATVAFGLYATTPIRPGAVLLVDVLWLSCYAVLSVAAVQRVRGPLTAGTMPVTAHARRTAPRWYDLGAAALLMVTVPYILYEARYGGLGEVEFWILATATFGVAILVIARSIVLTSENGSLLSHTVVDPLTGVFNHRYFKERVSVELDRARRTAEPLSVLLFDIDGFGLVNERRGHSGGDRCLTRVAEILRLHEGAGDTVCRMGGDEFAVIMGNTGARAAAERARAIQDALVSDPHTSGCASSVSVGIATCPDHATERTTLLAKADGALYWAQATGTGNVVVYDEHVVEALGPEERLHIAEEQSYMQTVESLASAVDARDPYTQFHSRNVSRHAERLALHVGLAPNHARLVQIAGLLHDVGKIGVPDSILRKPSPLTPEERQKIEEHPDLGQRILSATIFKEILPWVLSHHECWDGSGYPQGLKAEEIPFEARILAVCDSFDAMVSDRPYRKGIALEVAIREIEINAGIQFDPELTDAFIELVRSDEGLFLSEPSFSLADKLGIAAAEFN